MKCFYCPRKDTSLVPWDSLSLDDQTFLLDKYPDAGQGAALDLCVRSARPSAFFSRRSSSTSSSPPPISGFWAATAFGSSSCVLCPPSTERDANGKPVCIHPLRGSIRRGARAVHARCGYWGCSIDPFIQSQSGVMVTPQSPREVVQIPDAVRTRCARGADTPPRHAWQAFSARLVTKNAKQQSVRDLHPRQQITSTGCIPLDHCLVSQPVHGIVRSSPECVPPTPIHKCYSSKYRNTLRSRNLSP